MLEGRPSVQVQVAESSSGGKVPSVPVGSGCYLREGRPAVGRQPGQQGQGQCC